MELIVKCPKCGAKLLMTEDGEYFCHRCGIIDRDEFKWLESS